MSQKLTSPLIKAAINGSRTKLDSTKIPTSKEEILAEAKLSVIAGAQQIHFHVRDKNGRETLDGKFVAEQLSLLRQHLLNIPIGISTGDWIEPNFELRKKLINGWTTFPDFVSVNFGEDNCEQIIKMLLDKAVSIEAGISKVADAKKLINSGLLKYCFRILIEPQEHTISGALENVSAIEKVILPVISRQEILLHGLNGTCWALIEKAFERNYSTRVGFEDTLYIDETTKAESNAALIKKTLSFKK
ncbi:3-keto-5-aminohexanoate cleavage protein [Olivibacter sp. XZL3]|uniref:3-keto-5-aminohexanoate cleavage protein n=1 Tax=Olivibacter sp. XZL3 TaxID=1735116 RepID=UPI001416F519|nr:3-keto-5-aminohexanoate cleavage protein [Olivibacter sp. XZL3]